MTRSAEKHGYNLVRITNIYRYIWFIANSPSGRGGNSPLDRSQIITKGMWHNLNIIGVIISSRTGNTGGTCNSPWGTWGTCNTWIWSWLGWRFRTATSGWGPTLVGSSIWTSATIYRINVNAPEKINQFLKMWPVCETFSSFHVI